MDVPTIEEYAEAKVGVVARAAAAHDVRIVDEPGRALVANSCVTLYTVETIKRNVSTWVAVDGGMSDNLRPMLYGARYEAQIADRFGGGTPCHLVGKHCESSDVIVRDAELADPRVGDVVVTPVTGAYGFSMANNYNGIPRPPVVFCKDGDARVVVRRETYEDLFHRDVEYRSAGLPASTSLPRRAARPRHRRRRVRRRCWRSAPTHVEHATGLRPELSGVLTRSRGDFEDDPRRTAT